MNSMKDPIIQKRPTAAEVAEHSESAIRDGLTSALAALSAWVQCIETPNYMDDNGQRDVALSALQDVVAALGDLHRLF